MENPALFSTSMRGVYFCKASKDTPIPQKNILCLAKKLRIILGYELNKLRLLRHNQHHYQISPKSGAASKQAENEEQAHNGRIDADEFRQTRTNACNHAVAT